jgi:FixJ family two-component response regulator
MTCKKAEASMTSSDAILESPPASSVVFVIESDSSLRQSLDTLPHHPLWRIEMVASPRALLELRRTPVPCCLVLNVSHPDDLPLPPWPDDVPVICISEAGDVSLSVRAMKAGALDVLTKPAEGASLLEAVRLALKRSEERLRQEAELNRMRHRYASLSRREREVMALVAAGRMNKRVADDLGISVITVKAHRGRVMRKMKAQSLANLVIMSFLLQLTPSDQFARSASARVQTSAEERHARIAVGLQFRERLTNRTPGA